jgi:hypothetical protein
MKNDKIFRKIVQIVNNNNIKLNHKTPLILMGSCFSSEIGKRLGLSGFNTHQPFGTIFNPITLGENLIRLYNKSFFYENDLTFNREVFYSWAHSGKSYSNKNSELLLKDINNEIRKIHKSLINETVLILTFGTSIVYEHNNNIVGNCHKHPSSYFSKRRLTVNDIVSHWKNIITSFQNHSFIFTVSPVRHYKDGIIENNRSKASLILAIDELVKLFPNQVSYFPSYEIVMDELRDYRFYNADMIHPSKESVDYIWSKFQETHMSKSTIDTIVECEKIRQSLNHKPFSSDTKDYQLFLHNLKEKISLIFNKTPHYDWSNELEKIDKELLV